MKTTVPLNDRYVQLLQITTILSIGAFLICEIYDFDVWWHIAIGNDILTRFSVPSNDHFAVASLGRDYHDSHWLFQVLLAASHHLGGMVGVELTMIVLWAITLFYVYRSVCRWLSPSLSYIFLFVAAMASSERFLPRPEVVTYLMISIFYYCLQEEKHKILSNIFIFFLLQTIWTNSHGLFVIGPFMAGCYWASLAVKRLQGGVQDFSSINRLMVALLIATLITPYGIKNWYYASLLFTEVGPSAPRLLKTIQELSPTFGAEARSAPAFWFYLAIVIPVLITTVILVFRRHFNYERLMIAAAMLLASLSGRRNIVLFSLVGIPFMAENIGHLITKSIKGLRFILIGISLAMLGWGWYAISGNYYLMMQIPARFGLGATPSFFPHALPDFLKRIEFKGQVFNSNNLGGFYLYHSYPDRLPLTDGRWEVYDLKVFDYINGALTNPLLWEQFLSRYHIEGILLQHKSYEARTLLPKLPKDPYWRLVYYDHAASFWIHSNLSNIPPVASLSPDAPLPVLKRVEDCLILYSFLQFMDSPELAIRDLQQGLVFGKKTEVLLEDIGSLQVKIGKLDEAEKTFQKLIDEYPSNVTAINNLSFIAFTKGDINKAKTILSLGLERHPDNKDIRANYLKVSKAKSGGVSSDDRR